MRVPVWHAAPTWCTRTRSASPSQSSATERTTWTWPDVSPLRQYSWRDRLQNVTRPVVRVRWSASSSIQPSMSTSPVSCCWTIAATSPASSRLSRAATSGSSADGIVVCGPVVESGTRESCQTPGCRRSPVSPDPA
ncbi:Uncharacterised protein [Mycobacteroides abscessus]|nr:Uncharacterised protein [Mycobacteroides abscessus]